MIYNRKAIRLNDGRDALLRNPKTDDAAQMLEYLKITSAETDFLIRYPEECTETLERESAFLQKMVDSPIDMMIVCLVDGKLAGNCHLALLAKLKTKHRASVAIALTREYWGLGIGTAMFEEMIQVAKDHGIHQMELEVIEGNERAMGLYRKMGFEVVAERPDAIRLKDGTLLKEFLMIKHL